MIDLGLATDLMIAAGTGAVHDRAGYRVVVTPSNPNHNGNALVIPARALATPAVWEPRFVAALPDAAHRTVLVDGEPAARALAPWIEAGFAATTSDVMIAEAMPAVPAPSGVTFAPVADWDAMVAITLASDAAEGSTGDAYAAFIGARIADQRALVERGAARWWGATSAAR